MPELLRVPALSIVVLVGVAGSGKSTFAARQFATTQVVSSDACRAMVADDARDQSATAAAFEVVHLVVARRLAAGRLTVVDATNVEAAARRPLLELAREQDVPAVAIVLDLPTDLAAGRAASRADRAVPAEVVRRQEAYLDASLPTLSSEGFSAVHVLRSEADVAAAAVSLVPAPFDRRAERGPFDAVGARHPAGRRAVFVGDFIDRGPNPAAVLRLAMGMVAAGDALAVAGNHEFKLVRALGGGGAGSAGPAKVGRNLTRTLELLAAEPAGFQEEAFAFCVGLPAHLLLDGGRLVVAHAGLKESYQGRDSSRVRAFALFGDTTGERDEYGFPVRLPWADDYRGRATVLYGHTPGVAHRWVNNTLCLDTGCCFGGALTAVRYPEREQVSVPARRVYHAPTRPLHDMPAA